MSDSISARSLANSDNLVPGCTWRTRPLPSQPQEHLAEPRQLCCARPCARESLALRVLEFDELADPIPSRALRECIGQRGDICRLRLPEDSGQVKEYGKASRERGSALILQDVALLFRVILLVELVDGTFGFRDCLLALGLRGLVPSADFFGLTLSPFSDGLWNDDMSITRWVVDVPDDLRFIFLDVLCQNWRRGERRGLWTRCKGRDRAKCRL